MEFAEFKIKDTKKNNYDLIIIGGGSAAFSAAIKAEGLGLTTLMVNGGLDFAQVIKDKKELVATLQEKKYMDVVSDFENLTLLSGWAEFKDGKTIVVDGKEEYTALRFIIATGATTNIPNIYAAGDAANTPSFVYTAATEGNTAVANAFTGAAKALDYSSLPWVVFTDPQIAGAGLDEEQAEARGIPFEVSKIELKDVPRAIAANDTRGFIKLIRHSETDKLIGARIVAPEGGELIQQLSMAIKYGITVQELAESFYPYLTLGEGIKLAAITFGKNVAKLSYCAN